MKQALNQDWILESSTAAAGPGCSHGAEEVLENGRVQQQTASLDGHVLDGISVAALLAVALFFMWLVR